MQLQIEKIFGLVFLLVGASHVLHPQRWVDFFTWLRSKTYGAFIVVIYTLPIAVILVALHNEWKPAPALFLTFAGWIMLVKCVVYALYPAAFNRVSKKGASAKGIAAAGIVAIIFSAVMLGDIYLF
jgi:hypothetical protein